VHLGGDPQLALGPGEHRRVSRRAQGTEGLRLGRQVQLAVTAREEVLERERAERPVDPLDQPQRLRLCEQRQRVGELGAGLAAPGRLVADDGAVGEPHDRLVVGPQLAWVGEQLVDEATDVAGVLDVGAERHDRSLDPPERQLKCQ
jgi:hypothetical protein